MTLDWGQRGRIGEKSSGSQIPQRVAFVINQILHVLDGTQLIANLPSPIQMTQGLSWLDNLVIPPLQSLTLQKVSTAQSIDTDVSQPQFTPKRRVSGNKHKIN